MALVLPVPVMAAQQSLASVTGQAQIQPMGRRKRQIYDEE